MGKQNKIEKEVLKTLEYLDEQDTLESNPYFYTRLEAEIASMENKKHSSKKIFSLGILQPGAIALLIIFNIMTFIFTFESKSEEVYSRDDYLKTIAAEYSLNEVNDDLPFTNE